MTETMTQAGIVGILALIILRETYQFVLKVKNKEQTNGSSGRRPTAEKVKAVQEGVDAVLSRLDRIVDRLEDIGDTLRDTRKKIVLTWERAERLGRQTDDLEKTVNEIAVSTRRKVDTQPNIP